MIVLEIYLWGCLVATLLLALRMSWDLSNEGVIVKPVRLLVSRVFYSEMAVLICFSWIVVIGLFLIEKFDE
ncbi:MAG: hypothetical protein ACWA5P_01805 [bacterium]